MDLAGDQEPKLDVIHHKWTPIMNNASIGVGYRKVMFSFSPRFRNKKKMSNESVRTRADETREQTKSNEQDKCSGRGEKIYDQEKVGPVLVLSLGASERCSRCPTDNRTARDARWREVNQRQLLEGRDDLLSLFRLSGPLTVADCKLKSTHVSTCSRFFWHNFFWQTVRATGGAFCRSKSVSRHLRSNASSNWLGPKTLFMKLNPVQRFKVQLRP